MKTTGIKITKTFGNGELTFTALFPTGKIFCKGNFQIANNTGEMTFYFTLPKAAGGENVEQVVRILDIYEFSCINARKVYDEYRTAKRMWIYLNPQKADLMIEYHQQNANKWLM